MSHLDEVIARVDAAIEESVIAHMNELLIALMAHTGTSGGSYPSSRKTKAAS